jgi:hypothetical protein
VNIDKTAAIEGLLNRKKSFNTKPYEAKLSDIDEKLEKLAPLDAKLEGVREGIREVDQEFAIETARRKREARKLIETDKGVEYEDDEDIEEGFEALRRNSTFLDADLHEGEKPPKPLTERLWFILLTGLFVIGVISALVYILPFEAAVRQLFIVCTVLFVAVTIVEGLYAKGAFEGDVVTPTEDDFKQVIYELERKTEAYQDVEIDMSFANEYMDKKAELRTLENAILEKIQAREGLKEERLTCAAKLKKLQDEVDAIDLAIKTITDVSAEIHDDLGFLINDKISDIVSEITDGRYGDVKLDEEFRIKVWDGSSYVSVKHLNAGAVEQVYLAIRLGVARVLCRNKMPLIIDDIFTNYDEKRFANILNCLKTIDTEQIILMTSNNHIRDMLDGLDIHYNYIELD